MFVWPRREWLSTAGSSSSSVDKKQWLFKLKLLQKFLQIIFQEKKWPPSPQKKLYKMREGQSSIVNLIFTALNLVIKFNTEVSMEMWKSLPHIEAPGSSWILEIL